MTKEVRLSKIRNIPEDKKKMINIIIGRYGNFSIDLDNFDLTVPKDELFRRLTEGRGRPKSHCSDKYPNKENEIKNS